MATTYNVPKNVKNFVMRYYSPDPEKRGTVERKAWKRFKDVSKNLGFAVTDDSILAALFEDFTGLTPTYSSDHDAHDADWYEDMQQAAAMLTLALDDTYQSVSDLFAHSPLYNQCKYASWEHISYALPDKYDHLRKCFKDMAAQGIIDCLEVKTCGKCAIRLYKLKED